MRIIGRLLLVAGLVTGGLLAGGPPALAHNSLTGSNPEDGETVERAPERVRLTFLASVDSNNAEFDVTAPDGASLVAGDPKVDDNTVRIPLRPGPAGDYEVAWRVLSSDGDWVDGTFTFTVTVGEEPSPSPTPAASPTPSPTPSAIPAAGDVEEAAGPGPAWWVWALVALAVAVPAGYVGYRLRRRANRSS